MIRRSGSLRVALGLDFGTESVRAILLGMDGHEYATHVIPYPKGQITKTLPDQSTALAAKHVAQCAVDWTSSAAHAVRGALEKADVPNTSVVGVGVDFTSCTPIPCLSDGTPLYLSSPAWKSRPHAWPVLWKHHGAQDQSEEITAAALAASDLHTQDWLSRYGGVVGCEWLLPKALECFDKDREAFERTAAWVEAGDWFVWQLVGEGLGLDACLLDVKSRSDERRFDDTDSLVRSSCQAGYKACWSRSQGYPTAAFLNSVRPGFGDALLDRLQVGGPGKSGSVKSPGEVAGYLNERGAALLGLPSRCADGSRVAVAASTIDAHSGVPGVVAQAAKSTEFATLRLLTTAACDRLRSQGVGDAGTMVMIMGTSGCYMLCAEDERKVEGCVGRVEGGILPGLVGYEMGQAAMGDAFAWLKALTGQPLSELSQKANTKAKAKGGASAFHSPLMLDWVNGCRSPYNNAELQGAFTGLSMETGPEDLYMGVAGGLACGARSMVASFGAAGVPVDAFVATGGLPHHAPALVQTFADALGAPILIHPSTQGPAVGAAILGATAAGCFDSVSQAVGSMASSSECGPGVVVDPDLNSSTQDYYTDLYGRYIRLANLEVNEKALSKKV